MYPLPCRSEHHISYLHNVAILVPCRPHKMFPTQETRGIHSMLGQCWGIIVDVIHNRASTGSTFVCCAVDDASHRQLIISERTSQQTRWADVVQMVGLYKCFVFAGILPLSSKRDAGSMLTEID